MSGSDLEEPAPDQVITPVLIYEPNPKHKPIPTPGRHGSICPPYADGPGLLQESDLTGCKRYATDGTEAYCAQEHIEGKWHGYPVGWEEVPPRLVADWIASGKVTRRTVRRARQRG
ncbi:hypothetical protein Acor_74890 [Acrocarpospora corrugata]|uniref:Uncharacterized protein n=1 Tax=Acrocarpospora corrugata TaxID=35763 RepID=A0A5M3WEC4_9ACTN|nr:hypothetical protein Acor_74890 [Acrocarpospora corrugata]